MKIQQLEKLASEMIGDGQKPNLFFVSVAGLGVVGIYRDFERAHKHWQVESMNKDKETMLEDRLWGVIASVEPESEGSKILVRYDDASEFKKMYK